MNEWHCLLCACLVLCLHPYLTPLYSFSPPPSPYHTHRCTADHTSAGQQFAPLAHSRRQRRLLWVHHPRLAVCHRNKMALWRSWAADKHFSRRHRQQSVAGAAESETQSTGPLHLLGHEWGGRRGEQLHSLEGPICTRLQSRYVLG